MAAVLALGGFLSHRSAAALWRVLPSKPGPIDISVVGDGGRSARNGIRIHRSRTLRPHDTTRRLGIAVTTPTRTFIDLRRAAARGDVGAVSAEEMRQAIRQAGVLGLRVDAAVEADNTRSELEYLFLRLCERHRLPKPEVNVRIDSFLVDFIWRDRRLIIETDGYRYHRGHAAFEEDHDRDLKLKALGYEVIRLTYRQVVDDPNRIADTLRVLLTS